MQTSINTGPRGPIRLAQGIQAFIGVGREWLADVTQVSVLSLFQLLYFVFVITVFSHGLLNNDWLSNYFFTVKMIL